MAKMARPPQPSRTASVAPLCPTPGALPAPGSRGRPLRVPCEVKLYFEEPYASIAHVRVCGSPGRATAPGHPTGPKARVPFRRMNLISGLKRAFRLVRCFFRGFIDSRVRPATLPTQKAVGRAPVGRPRCTVNPGVNNPEPSTARCPASESRGRRRCCDRL